MCAPFLFGDELWVSAYYTGVANMNMFDSHIDEYNRIKSQNDHI